MMLAPPLLALLWEELVENIGLEGKPESGGSETSTQPMMGEGVHY